MGKALLCGFSAILVAACGNGGGHGDTIIDSGTHVDGGGTDSGLHTDAGMCAADEMVCSGACVKTATDSANCGMCGHACTTGQHCTGGTCGGCGASETLCGTICSNTMTDSANCGMCGHACTTGQMCSGGTCSAACPAPSMVCTTGSGSMMTSTCINVTTDHDNCGTCGHACASGQTCMGGTCSCTSGLMACSGACTDTTTDNANCGTCGHACTGGQTCAASTCTCPASDMFCGGTCVNTTIDNGNCGSCGHACGAGTSCGGSTCTAMCASMPGTVFCGGTPPCVNPVTDSMNCGGCGLACASTESCLLGACRPLNDLMPGAISIPVSTAAEQTLTGSTTHATPSGASEPSTNTTVGTMGCGTITSNNVWYTFTLTGTELVYADTIDPATTFDTELYFTDSTGAPEATSAVAKACNDDSGCGATTSRIAMQLNAGTYYIVVAGFSSHSGDFTLHFQHLPYQGATNYSYTYPMVSGTGAAAANSIIVGETPHHPFSCEPTSALGEDAYWFISCGTAVSTVSLCGADMGVWQRTDGTNNFDPAMELVSGSTGMSTTCDDDATPFTCPANYMGMAGDGANYGSRISQMMPRGLNIATISNRTTFGPMNYTLGYAIN